MRLSLDQPAFNRRRLNAKKLIVSNCLEQLSASKKTRVAPWEAASIHRREGGAKANRRLFQAGGRYPRETGHHLHLRAARDRNRDAAYQRAAGRTATDRRPAGQAPACIVPAMDSTNLALPGKQG